MASVAASIDDLNDNLPEFLADCGREFVPVAERAPAPVIAPLVHVEPCKACRGTGKFRSWSGRTVGDCFKCKGKGKLSFKTAPEVRAASQAKAASKREADRIALRDAIEQWKRDHPVEWQWMFKAAQREFEFAEAMVEALCKWGTLTDRQLAVVRNCVIKAEEAKERRAQMAAAAPVIDIAAIEIAFNNAKSKGIKSPKLRLDSFKFAPAKAHSANAGAIYVTEGETYLGKVVAGKFQRVRACDDATETRILAVAADPKQAAIAYGRRFGSCSVCGRELTRHASIDAGIGPICAEKYGW